MWAGSKEDIAKVNLLIEQHSDEWPYYWLDGRGLKTAAEAWLKGHDIQMKAKKAEGAA
ncbi:hypothetical protein AGMMS49957_18990 [Synergistales bacterium]|nr:hypothetical protein AGMMS49957_18990 [Synergistales bacterium]